MLWFTGREHRWGWFARETIQNNSWGGDFVILTSVCMYNHLNSILNIHACIYINIYIYHLSINLSIYLSIKPSPSQGRPQVLCQLATCMGWAPVEMTSETVVKTRGFQGNTHGEYMENTEDMERIQQSLEKLGTSRVLEQQTCGFRRTKMRFDCDEEEKQNWLRRSPNFHWKLAIRKPIIVSNDKIPMYT